LLHGEALEELRLAAKEHEVAAHREAKGTQTATLLEEVPEGISVNAKPSLREKP
jgi:hypothetical protein